MPITPTLANINQEATIRLITCSGPSDLRHSELLHFPRHPLSLKSLYRPSRYTDHEPLSWNTKASIVRMTSYPIPYSVISRMNESLARNRVLYGRFPGLEQTKACRGSQQPNDINNLVATSRKEMPLTQINILRLQGIIGVWGSSRVT